MNTHEPRASVPALFSLHSLCVLLLAAGLATACSSSSSNGGGKTKPQLGVATAQDGITIFGQAIRVLDGRDEVIPGYANYWDLARDFSIDSGGNDQFDGALTMDVDGEDFPGNQAYSELGFYTPLLGTADGLLVVHVYAGATSSFSTGEGAYAVVLAPTQNSRLQQTLDLTGAVAPITLTYMTYAGAEEYSNFPTEEQFYRVVIKNTANGLLQTLFSSTPAGDVGDPSLPVDLSAYAGQVIRLVFEARVGAQNPLLIDGVSVVDDNAVEYVTNGDFETGDLTGWTRNTPSYTRNITSGARTLAGLDVQRSFFATPRSFWGRHVDTFTNNTMATINETVTYEVDLGSNGSGVIYSPANTMAMALSTWDTTGSTRDVGWVFGGADSVSYLSTTGLATNDGDDVIQVTYDISVDPGETVALVNFLIMTGEATGDAAASVADTAITVDEQAENIVAGWSAAGSPNAYSNGMTQAQIDAVVNF